MISLSLSTYHGKIVLVVFSQLQRWIGGVGKLSLHQADSCVGSNGAEEGYNQKGKQTTKMKKKRKK